METMATKIPTALAKEVDRLVASGRYANRSEVLRVAVRALLESRASARAGGAEPPIPPRIKAFRSRLQTLAEDARYRHRWVALHGDQVVDADDDHDDLVRRVLDRAEEPIDIGFATEHPEPRRIRLASPISARRS